MTAAAVIEGMVDAGTTLGTAMTNARQSNPTLSWTTFLTTTAFSAAYAAVAPTLEGLIESSVNSALTDIRTKQASLLGGGAVTDLSPGLLPAYSALLDVENQLMSRYAANFGRTADCLAWLVDDALPILIKAAPIVLPLLL